MANLIAGFALLLLPTAAGTMALVILPADDDDLEVYFGIFWILVGVGLVLVLIGAAQLRTVLTGSNG